MRGADGPPRGDESRYAASGDVTPRLEPVRTGGPNKPYEIGGRRGLPVADDVPMRQTGIASWYGRQYHGRPPTAGPGRRRRSMGHVVAAGHGRPRSAGRGLEVAHLRLLQGLDAGFADQAHRSRSMRRVFGVTPATVVALVGRGHAG
jgi:hypothetical protein